jgi:hypothetical protein
MTTKVVEIRDRATRISAVAIRLDPADEAERATFGLSGYGTTAEDQAGYIILLRIDPVAAHADKYDWSQSARTMQVAHDHIERHFNGIESGDVIDVEFILGESHQVKRAEWKGRVQ